MKNRIREIALDGTVRQNPTFRLVLGTCPTLAVTTTAFNSLGMGLAVTFVLICSNVIISLLRNIILCNNRGNGETMSDNEYTEYQYEVMAKVEINTFTNSCRMGYDYSYYLPAEVYKTMVQNPGTMSYVCNVEDGSEAAMDAFLQNYTENAEPVMAYSSRQSKAKEFESMRNMVLIVGGVLSLIIGLIGVLNFINSMLTSILTRKREFAMLQSIGMTTSQLRKMLIVEGLIYTASSGAVSLALGVGVSALLANTIAKSLWFFTYQFTLLPLIITIPILLVIGVLLPIPVLKSVEKQSIVDRLRETEA